MSTRKKLQVTTELSTLDLSNLYISVDDFPKKNCIYFNFTIDGNSNGFFVSREDWIQIIDFIENNIKNG